MHLCANASLHGRGTHLLVGLVRCVGQYRTTSAHLSPGNEIRVASSHPYRQIDGTPGGVVERQLRREVLYRQAEEHGFVAPQLVDEAGVDLGRSFCGFGQLAFPLGLG